MTTGDTSPSLRLLAVGAHPDDIEIGAAALISKAVSLGIQTHFLVLTDDDGGGGTRRAEATQAAEALGLAADHVLFAGLRDGRLRAESRSVSRVRKLVSEHGLTPTLVVTHSTADSHNDHVEANRIAHAAFRQCVFLHYSVHLSREQQPFAPRIFVEVSAEKLEKKSRALARHDSQRARLDRRDLAAYEASLGKLARLDRCEAFEISPQEGADVLLEEILALSESPFHRFWNRIIHSQDITLFYEAHSTPGAPIDWPTNHENAGRDQLRQSFREQWLPCSPLSEAPSNSPAVQQIIQRQSVILAGGAVRNLVVRDLYNRFRGTQWVIDYEMPRLEPAFLYSRVTGQRFYPEYDPGNNLVTDFGLIALVANPFAAGEYVICAAGASGLATRLALEFLADPGSRPDVAQSFDKPGNTQLAFSVRADNSRIEVMDVRHE